MISVKKLVNDLEFKVIAGEKGLNRKIEDANVTRPGLEFAGFFDFFQPKRIMLVGSKEASFLKTVTVEEKKKRTAKLFEMNPPCLICSVNVEVPPYLIEVANQYDMPLLKTDLRTTPIASRLYNYLQMQLAPVQTIHGVLMDINGMGTLIMGKSGIGKSETAMELIKRGHQLISDDRVDIIEKEAGYIIGRAPKVLERYIELRGIGIVDVVSLYGAGAFRKSKKIRLVVELENWEDGKYYDRLGLGTLTKKFFDTEIPEVVIPVLPGRNLALLIESAALNEKLKIFGINSALNFTTAINKLAQEGKDEDDDR